MFISVLRGCTALGITTLFFLFAISSGAVVDPGAIIKAPDEPGTILKGPTSKASVKGPSGPIILSAGDTGTVASSDISGGVVAASAQSSGDVIAEGPLVPVGAPVLASPVVESLSAVSPLDTSLVYESIPQISPQGGLLINAGH